MKIPGYFFRLLSASLVLYCLLGCVTTEVPVTAYPAGEWQRPLDLKLVSATQEKKGSLSGLRIRVECGEWNSKSQSIRSFNDTFCLELRSQFISYGAVIENQASQDYQLWVRLLKSPTASLGCGLNGWLTYITLALVPCKTHSWRDGLLQILGPSGKVLGQFPLLFHRIQHFGFVALNLPLASKKIQANYDRNLKLYAINRTYTLAVQRQVLEIAQ
jgi:hypothetical protein